MQDTSNILNDALAHHQAGRLAEAHALYQQILRAQPKHPDALHFLGLLACQTGQHEVGITLMRQSVGLNRNAIYLNNLGNALKEQGSLTEAIDSYRHAVALKPDYAEAHNNLGDALREARQPDASMQSCAQAITLRPGYAEAYNNLGNALKDMGDLDSAALAYGKAIAFRPDYAEAWNNVGNLLMEQSQHQKAIDAYSRAIELNPTRAITYNCLGVAHIARGDLDPAIVTLQQAIALKPDDAGAHNNLGSALRDAGQPDAAAEHFGQAAALMEQICAAHEAQTGDRRQKPGELSPAEAYNALGNAYFGLARFDAAIESYRKSVSLDPTDADVHHSLAVTLLKHERAEEALASARTALSLNESSTRMQIQLGDVMVALGDATGAISSYRKALERSPDVEQPHTSLLWSLAIGAEGPVEDYLADARYFGERMAAQARPYRHTPAPRGARKLRIGFVSGDLRRHPVGIFLESVIAHMDASRIESIAYVTLGIEDEITARLKPHFSQWKKLYGQTNEEAARIIYEDRIDILVDLSGHTACNRLAVFAWKPAPVQVSWLGFFASTGLDAMDYFLADPHTLPVEEEAHFVEKPWRLPDSYLCFTPPAHDVEVGPLPMLENGHVTFAYFGKLVKVTDRVIGVWARLLDAVPGSRLRLKAHELGRDFARRKTVERFAALGVDESRLLLDGGSPRKEYLEAYNKVDIMLSPFPYPGGTTTAEGLWMGTPVLAMQGDRFVTHICESLLHAAGLADWIARDEADYIAKAAAFAGDPQRLATLRAGLREHVTASPLCDARRFAGNLDDAFHAIWREYETGGSAAG